MKGMVELASDAAGVKRHRSTRRRLPSRWRCAMVEVVHGCPVSPVTWLVSVKNSHEAEWRALLRTFNHGCRLLERGQAKLVKILHDFTLSRKEREELGKTRPCSKRRLILEQIKGKKNPADGPSRGRPLTPNKGKK